MTFRRPDDVSQEEAERLIELFDRCLTDKIVNSSEDELSSEFLSTMARLKLDADTQREFRSILSRASDGRFYEEERRRLEFLLQSVAAKNQSEEEHDELRRLEFMFALALLPYEDRRSSGTGLSGIPDLAKSVGASLFGMLTGFSATPYYSSAASDDDESNGPIAQFKERVLWDVLGDARPRTTTEFLRVLRDRGIILRNSP